MGAIEDLRKKYEEIGISQSPSYKSPELEIPAELLEKYDIYKPEDEAPISPPPPAEGVLPTPTGDRSVIGELVGGVKRSYPQFKETYSNVAAAIGTIAGNEPLREWGLKSAAEQKKEAEEITAPASAPNILDSYSKGTMLEDLPYWLASTVGEQAMNIGESIVAATGGAIIGGTTGPVGAVGGAIAAGTIGKGFIKNYLSKKVAKMALEYEAKGLAKNLAVKEAVRNTARELGAKAGIVIGTIPLEWGGTFGELAETSHGDIYGALTSLGTSIPAGMLEIAGGGSRIIGKLLNPTTVASKEVSKNVVLVFGKKLFSNLAEQMPEEFMQEVGQEILSVFANKLNDPETNMTSKQNILRYLASGLAGAAVGGVFGATGASIDFMKELTADKIKEKEPVNLLNEPVTQTKNKTTVGEELKKEEGVLPTQPVTPPIGDAFNLTSYPENEALLAEQQKQEKLKEEKEQKLREYEELQSNIGGGLSIPALPSQERLEKNAVISKQKQMEEEKQNVIENNLKTFVEEKAKEQRIEQQTAELPYTAEGKKEIVEPEITDISQLLDNPKKIADSITNPNPTMTDMVIKKQFEEKKKELTESPLPNPILNRQLNAVEEEITSRIKTEKKPSLTGIIKVEPVPIGSNKKLFGNLKNRLGMGKGKYNFADNVNKIVGGINHSNIEKDKNLKQRLISLMSMAAQIGGSKKPQSTKMREVLTELRKLSKESKNPRPIIEKIKKVTNKPALSVKMKEVKTAPLPEGKKVKPKVAVTKKKTIPSPASLFEKVKKIRETINSYRKDMSKADQDTIDKKLLDISRENSDMSKEALETIAYRLGKVLTHAETIPSKKSMEGTTREVMERVFNKRKAAGEKVKKEKELTGKEKEIEDKLLIKHIERNYKEMNPIAKETEVEQHVATVMEKMSATERKNRLKEIRSKIKAPKENGIKFQLGYENKDGSRTTATKDEIVSLMRALLMIPTGSTVSLQDITKVFSKEQLTKALVSYGITKEEIYKLEKFGRLGELTQKLKFQGINTMLLDAANLFYASSIMVDPNISTDRIFTVMHEVAHSAVSMLKAMGDTNSLNIIENYYKNEEAFADAFATFWKEKNFKKQSSLPAPIRNLIDKLIKMLKDIGIEIRDFGTPIDNIFSKIYTGQLKSEFNKMKLKNKLKGMEEQTVKFKLKEKLKDTLFKNIKSIEFRQGDVYENLGINKKATEGNNRRNIEAAKTYIERKILQLKSFDEEGRTVQEINQVQAKYVKEWAEIYDFLIKGDAFHTAWKWQTLGGAEHNVIHLPNDMILKERFIARRFTKRFSSAESFTKYLNRLLIHNIIFKEAPYRLLGVLEDSGNFVVEQPFILEKNIENLTLKEIERSDKLINNYMEKFGFTNNGIGFYLNSSIGIEIHDLHSGNVIFTKKGNIVFIDPMIKIIDMNKARKFIEDNTIFEEETVSEVKFQVKPINEKVFRNLFKEKIRKAVSAMTTEDKQKFKEEVKEAQKFVKDVQSKTSDGENPLSEKQTDEFEQYKKELKAYGIANSVFNPIVNDDLEEGNIPPDTLEGLPNWNEMNDDQKRQFVLNKPYYKLTPEQQQLANKMFMEESGDIKFSVASMVMQEFKNFPKDVSETWENRFVDLKWWRKILANPSYIAQFFKSGEKNFAKVMNVMRDRIQYNNDLNAELMADNKTRDAGGDIDFASPDTQHLLFRVSNESAKRTGNLYVLAGKYDVHVTDDMVETMPQDIQDAWSKLNEEEKTLYEEMRKSFRYAGNTQISAFETFLYRVYTNKPWFTYLRELIYKSQDYSELKKLKEVIKLRDKLDKDMYLKHFSTNKELPYIVRNLIDNLSEVEILQLVKAAERIKPIQVELKKYRSIVNNANTYYPRMRIEGEYKVIGTYIDKEGNRKTAYFEMAGNKLEANRMERAAKIKYPDATFKQVYESSSGVSSLFGAVSPMAVEEYMEKAIADLEKTKELNEETADEIKESLTESLNKLVMARGFRRHFIERSEDNPEGYEEENVKEVFSAYMSGTSGLLSKTKAVYDFYDALKEMNSAKHPKLFEYSLKYIHDMLRNTSEIDRHVGFFRAIAFVWYLGISFRGAVAQLTQNPTIGFVELNKIRKNLGLSGMGDIAYAKAMADVAINKFTGNFNSEETSVLHRGSKDGITDALAVNFIRGISLTNMGHFFNKLSDIISFPFSHMEVYNRKSALIAGYRTYRESGMPDEQAYAAAKKFVSTVHFEYGKINLPEILRGEGLMSAGGRMFYTYRTYSHNYLLYLSKNMTVKDFGVVMHSLAYMALFGGIFAVPFLDDLLDSAESYWGVPYRQNIKRAMKNVGGEMFANFGAKGLPSIINADISGSLKINLMGTDTNSMLFGVYKGLADKIIRAQDNLLKGSYLRAIEEASPTFVENVLKANREYTEGATTRTGKPVTEETGRQYKPSLRESLQQGLGFRSVQRSGIQEAHRSLANIQTYYNDWRKKIYAKFELADTAEERRTARDERFKYNVESIPYRSYVPRITNSSIKKAVKDKIDKKFRKFAQTYEVE